MTRGTLRDDLAALHAASYGWALACCRWNRSEAEDVLGNVYVKVLEGTARFDSRSSLRTWLFAVIRRTAAEERRRTCLHALLPLRWMLRFPDADVASDPSDIVAGQESVTRLRRALLLLPVRQRELLHLVFYADATVEEAAAILDVSVGTARTHYHRGKARLRELLGEDLK